MWRRNGGLGPPGGTARVARGSTGEDRGGRCFPPQLQRHNLPRWQKSMKETVDETVVVFAPRTGRSIWGTNRLWPLALALTRENSHSQVLAATDLERRCPIMLITGACARTCRAGFSSFFVVDRPRVPPPIRAPVQGSRTGSNQYDSEHLVDLCCHRLPIRRPHHSPGGCQQAASCSRIGCSCYPPAVANLPCAIPSRDKGCSTVVHRPRQG